MATKAKTEKLTPYGQKIIDLLCDHLAKKGFAYWLNEIGTTDELTEWLAKRLRKSIKSVTGAFADLVEKGYIGDCEYMTSGTVHRSSLYTFRLGTRTLSHEAWQAWRGWDQAKLEKTYGDKIEYWIEWDGLDGTEVGFEFKVSEQGVFGKKAIELRAAADREVDSYHR